MRHGAPEWFYAIFQRFPGGHADLDQLSVMVFTAENRILAEAKRVQGFERIKDGRQRGAVDKKLLVFELHGENFGGMRDAGAKDQMLLATGGDHEQKRRRRRVHQPLPPAFARRAFVQAVGEDVGIAAPGDGLADL